MTDRVQYEFKTDKAGRKYALRVEVKTGKKTRINYKLAQKRSRDITYRRKKAVTKKKEKVKVEKITGKLRETKTGATYADYEAALPGVTQDIIDRRKRKGLKPLSPAVLRGKAKQETIDYRTGTATRLRYAWVYRIVVERYFDEDLGETIVECDTSIFRARGLKRNGDEFEKMASVCQTIYDKLQAMDLCSLEGGACVVHYNKNDKSIIDQFELGKGCGFSFDFKNYDHDENADVNADGFSWI